MFMYLPTSLLSIIVSFLPFQEAARTSILSKKWQHIWYSTKNIEIHESFFVKSEISDEEKDYRRRVFLNFIQQWIQMNREPIADTFRLSFSNPTNHVDVLEKCIRFAIRRKVKNLDLDFSDRSWSDQGDYHEGLLRITLNYFGNELESLRLFSCNFTFPEPTRYNALKSLSLGWIKLNFATLKSLLKACPSLVSLSLVKCWGLEYLQISEAPRLKRLVLDKCQIDLQMGILVEARNLQFLKYSGRFVPFNLEYLRTLLEVALDFGIETDNHGEGELLCNLLRELWSTRVLTVCSYTLKVIQTAEDPLMLEPKLESVQHLILKTTSLSEIEYYGISFFLNSCPSLEVLSIHMSSLTGLFNVEPPYKMEEHPFLIKDEYAVAFKCLRKSLRVVEVKGYKGYSCEERVLRYLLRHGIILEDMFIHLSETIGFQYLDSRQCFLRRAQKLLQLPRASPNLRISIR